MGHEGGEFESGGIDGESLSAVVCRDSLLTHVSAWASKCNTYSQAIYWLRARALELPHAGSPEGSDVSSLSCVKTDGQNGTEHEMGRTGIACRSYWEGRPALVSHCCC